MKKLVNIIMVGSLFGVVTCCTSGKADKRSAEAEKSATAPENTRTAEFLEGKKYYTQYCMVCHQQDGRGVQGLNPPLVRTDWVLGDKNRLIKVVLNGLSEEIEIDGETFSNSMGSFATLTDREISLTLSFIRQSFGNDAPPITEEEVADARK